MTFSKEWEVIYRKNSQMSIWPWSDVVRYVMRYAKPHGNDFSVLELGCGSGANIPFFQHLRVRYFSIEGSETIVRQLWQKFPQYRETIVVGDFTEVIPFDRKFDLVVDRSSLTHNSTEAIKNALKLVHEAMKPEGQFIGIDWFSTASSDYENGISVHDAFTRYGYDEGPFANVGMVHFSDKCHLLELFSGFKMRMLEHKTVIREMPEEQYVLSYWNLIAEKEDAR